MEAPLRLVRALLMRMHGFGLGSTCVGRRGRRLRDPCGQVAGSRQQGAILAWQGVDLIGATSRALGG